MFTAIARRAAFRATVARSMMVSSARPMVSISSVFQRSFSAVAAVKPDMFCRQCEQTVAHTGCTTVGNCGKSAETSAVQDLQVHLLKGLCEVACAARAVGVAENAELNRHVCHALFSTMTNVDFDSARFSSTIKKTVELREATRKVYVAAAKAANKPLVTFSSAAAITSAKYDVDSIEALGRQFGSVSERDVQLGKDPSSLIDLVTFGLKGTSAYTTHAEALGKEDVKAYTEMQNVMTLLASFVDKKKVTAAEAGSLVGAALKVGEINVGVMAMLDAGHNARFGAPSPHSVRTTPVKGKAILISGHDMHDLEALLKQTEGKGINIYTHGEMLPAHAYPGLRKYAHLAGHYGNAWQLQKMEFASFPGPILMTTNCIIEPRRSYKERMFTTGEVGWPGCKHAKHGDYAALIECALNEQGFEATDPETKPLTVGYHHGVIMSVAGKVIDAVKDKQLKHVFLIGGCDGSEAERSYFTTVAKAAPKDTMILGVGCGKMRYHKHDFGTLGTTGLPRYLDMGQCNDSYGAVVVAGALAKAFGCGINDLPLSLVLSWFEQKAVAVLLSLLHLGVKRIRVGPALPAFITPSTLDLLVKTFDLKLIDAANPEKDLALMLQNK